MKLRLLSRKLLQPVALASLLAAAVFPGVVPAHAGEAPAPLNVTVGSASVYAGGTARIPVTLQQPSTAVASYGMQLDFDPERIEVLAVVPKLGSTDAAACTSLQEGCFQAFIDNAGGWVRAAWFDASGGDHPIANKQELFEIAVKPKGAAGQQALHVDVSNPEHFAFTGTDMNTIAAQLTEGAIKVSEKPRSTPAAPAAPPAAAADSSPVKVIIDGKEQEQSAIRKTERVNNKVVSTITVDNEKVIAQFEKSDQKTLVIPANGASDIVVGVLNGQLVKTMASKAAVVEVQTEHAAYILPAAQINIDQVSGQIGQDIALQDIVISVTIAATDADKVRQAQSAAEHGGMELVVAPVDFEVEASYGDKKIQVEQFNSYVDREIALPENVDPAKITTGVVLNGDGTLTHVPTKIEQRGGIYYAEISSMTNSTYSVIWNPKSFKDTDKHWSRSAVSDLASRLIVQGETAEAFAPNRPITRAEFSAMILRALGLHAEKAGRTAAFTDVSAADWYSDPVKRAASYGLVGGYADGSFHPNAQISREEAFVIIARAAALIGAQAGGTQPAADMVLQSFGDRAAIGGWARESAAFAVRQGIMEGYNGLLSPKANLTRAESAAIVQRLLVKENLINPAQS